MTVCAIILAVLLITVIPLIFWIKGYKSQEGWFVGTGVAISMAGVLLSLFIFSHIWPGYLFNKFCFLFLLIKYRLHRLTTKTNDVITLCIFAYIQ